MQVKSVREASVSGKRVLLRVDLNVPIKDARIIDDLRIRAIIPTLEFLHQAGASNIILLTHLGRPEGKVVEELKVAPVEARLRELTKVPFEIRENLRFDAREESNDEGFAKELAALGDIYVNDAFAVSHRAAASLVAITKFLPSYAGLLIEKELAHLSRALTPPPHSLAIVGGVKFETKAPLIEKLAKVYEKVLVGGAIANEYKNPLPNVLLPTDGVPQLEGMYDIGPETAHAWADMISSAPFVLWNGPLGMYENPAYRAGTDMVAKAVAASSGAVIGGGDTAAAVATYSFDPEKVFISTGGGAMLEFLVTGTLPALLPLVI